MLANKVVVITGAGTGLGKAVAVKAGVLGAKVMLISRTESELEATQSLIRREKGTAEFWVCDITKEDQVKATVKNIVERLGTIDYLVNNAGVWTDESLETKTPEKRWRALKTNVMGHINFTYEVLPLMKKKNAGYIFNVISTAGASDSPSGNISWCKTYGASKWAMSGFTKALLEDLKETKIKVTAFHPGGFDSMLYEKAGRSNPHNQPWMMKTDDVAEIVIFALTRPEDVMMERIVVSKMS